MHLELLVADLGDHEGAAVACGDAHEPAVVVEGNAGLGADESGF